MQRIRSHLDEVNMIAKLADVKIEQYNTSLVLEALISLLVDKQMISYEELAAKKVQLD